MQKVRKAFVHSRDKTMPLLFGKERWNTCSPHVCTTHTCAQRMSSRRDGHKATKKCLTPQLSPKALPVLPWTPTLQPRWADRARNQSISQDGLCSCIMMNFSRSFPQYDIIPSTITMELGDLSLFRGPCSFCRALSKHTVNPPVHAGMT